MREHLLQIENLYFGGRDSAASALNISVYRNELISICSSSSLSVDSLKNAYKNHQMNGRLTFPDKKTVSLSKGTPLKYIYSISRYAHLVPALSITDNIFSLRKCSFPHFLYNSKHARIAAADLVDELNLPVNIDTPVSELTAAEEHLLLLAKAFVSSAKLIILDNIVEYYTYAELCLLLDLIKLLQDRGVTFLVFTNGPSLLTQMSDRIFVTQNYEITNILYHTEYSDKLLSSMMLGDDPHITNAKKSYPKEEILLSLDWSCLFADLPRMELHHQECLCVFNYNGSNIDDIYDLFTRYFPYELDDKTCTSYSSAVKNGLAPISISRIEDYFFRELSLKDNLTLPILHKISTAGIINKKLFNYCIHSSLEKMNGNSANGTDVLLKSVLLRWQLANPKLMLISDLNVTDSDRPEIYPVLNDINKSGAALVILSSNLYDCLYFADSLLVIRNSADYRFFHKSDSASFVQDVKSYVYGSRDIP